jgi:hypothetical protein
LGIARKFIRQKSPQEEKIIKLYFVLLKIFYIYLCITNKVLEIGIKEMKIEKYACFTEWKETTNFVNKLQLNETAYNIRFKWEVFEYVVRWNEEDKKNK